MHQSASTRVWCGFKYQGYRYVLKILTAYRVLIDEVATRLLCNPDFDLSERAEIYPKHGMLIKGC